VAKTYRAKGIILKRFNYRETDRVLTIFTDNYGKMSCLAKGVRKTTSRKRGNIEPFTFANLHFAKGRGFDILTEADAVKTYPQIRENLERTFYGWQMCELVDRLTPYEQRSPQVFNLLKKYLGLLSSTESAEEKKLLTKFKTKLLKILGFGLPERKSERNLNAHIEEIIENKVNSEDIMNKLVK
jgi:DNA repair protein RecO (recombination protein O)